MTNVKGKVFQFISIEPEHVEFAGIGTNIKVPRKDVEMLNFPSAEGTWITSYENEVNIWSQPEYEGIVCSQDEFDGKYWFFCSVVKKGEKKRIPTTFGETVVRG